MGKQKPPLTKVEKIVAIQMAIDALRDRPGRRDTERLLRLREELERVRSEHDAVA
jgi:hypothetical protein